MGRHKAREEALKVLYALEVGHRELEEVLAEAKEFSGNDPQWEFTEKLTRSVCDSMAQVDSHITPFARDWPLFRMAAIDRTIIRMAVTEMLHFKDIPYEVTIDEAVELAKKYGDVDSGNFVNGILSSIHRQFLTSSPKG